MRAETIRSEVVRFVRRTPFRPFILSLENGENVAIEHPENIAFDPGETSGGGSLDFYVVSGAVRLYATFDAVTNVTTTDSVGHLG